MVIVSKSYKTNLALLEYESLKSWHDYHDMTAIFNEPSSCINDLCSITFFLCYIVVFFYNNPFTFNCIILQHVNSIKEELHIHSVPKVYTSDTSCPVCTFSPLSIYRMLFILWMVHRLQSVLWLERRRVGAHKQQDDHCVGETQVCCWSIGSIEKDALLVLNKSINCI